jgi:tRNA nucleotidyltransferase (CCA-adding enzyme)
MIKPVIRVLPISESWRLIRKRILTEIKPSIEEKKELFDFLAEIKLRLNQALDNGKIKADVEIHGSVARDTWLKGVKDADIFIVMDRTNERKSLFKVNNIVKELVGEGWTEAFAEHPYIKAEINGFNIEFIPCFKTNPNDKLFSAADRSPLHTVYVKKHLRVEQSDEVRLLKSFLRGIGVYGAEIKVGGFSGYLCELLIIAFGSFEEVIETVAKWGEPNVLQFETQRSIDSLKKRFKEPFIVIDPVDVNRNVASAVSETSFWTFVAAARAFAVKPELEFFRHDQEHVTSRNVLAQINGRGTDLVFVAVKNEDPPVPDTLWGQLFKAEKSLKRSLGEKSFQVLRSATWSDERERYIHVFELESNKLSQTVKKIGPPVYLPQDSNDFVAKYTDSETISGPGIEGAKWWVEVKRKNLDAQLFLKELLKTGAQEIGIPKQLSKKIIMEGEVFLNSEIEPHLRNGFIEFLYKFLSGRPDWLV